MLRRTPVARPGAACSRIGDPSSSRPPSGSLGSQDTRSTAMRFSSHGLFTVHRVGGTLLFEIPDTILGRDMALMSRYARVQQGLANGGDRLGPNMVVRWERRGDRIVLRAVSHSTTADEGDNIHIAVEN